VKPDINLVKVDPQLSHNKHPVDGALVGCWFILAPVLLLQPFPSSFFGSAQMYISVGFWGKTILV
jgi:hypothetical protein